MKSAEMIEEETSVAEYTLIQHARTATALYKFAPETSAYRNAFHSTALCSWGRALTIYQVIYRAFENVVYKQSSTFVAIFADDDKRIFRAHQYRSTLFRYVDLQYMLAYLLFFVHLHQAILSIYAASSLVSR